MRELTEEEFLKEIKNDYPQRLEEDFDGGCPCSYVEVVVDGKIFGFESNCWRISKNAQDLYVWGSHPKKEEFAELVKKELDKQEWYNPYTIIYRKRTW